ncbi:hypothetical protein BU17DRAFT_60311 [Hysterangium stoloniferum]|nr:hypothetical protein BU17DRAFT_60311 [Hysterangium stoloniferum]
MPQTRALLQLVADNLIVTLTSAAALAVMLFDISLTLDVEIQYIWRRNWSLTKVLYILSRYLGVFNGLAKQQPAFHTDVIFGPGMEFCSQHSRSTALHITADQVILGVTALLVLTRTATVRVLQTKIWPSCPMVVMHSFPPFVTTARVSVKDPKFCADIGCRLTRTIAMYFGLAIYKVMKHLGERGLLRTLMTEGDGQNMVSIFSFLLRDTVRFYFSTLGKTAMFRFILHCPCLIGMVLVNFMYCALFSDRFIAYAAVPTFTRFLVAAYSITGSRLILFLGGDVTNKTGVYKAGTEHRIDKTVNYEMMAMISNGSVLDETKSERGLSSLPILSSNSGK